MPRQEADKAIRAVSRSIRLKTVLHAALIAFSVWSREFLKSFITERIFHTKNAQEQPLLCFAVPRLDKYEEYAGAITYFR